MTGQAPTASNIQPHPSAATHGELKQLLAIELLRFLSALGVLIWH